jgi:nitroreductase
MRSRRSKRLFKDTPVERDVLEKVIEAARFAPSHHNDQSTEFIVVQDKKIIKEITTLTAEGIAERTGYCVKPLYFSYSVLIVPGDHSQLQTRTWHFTTRPLRQRPLGWAAFTQVSSFTPVNGMTVSENSSLCLRLMQYMER